MYGKDGNNYKLIIIHFVFFRLYPLCRCFNKPWRLYVDISVFMSQDGRRLIYQDQGPKRGLLCPFHLTAEVKPRFETLWILEHLNYGQNRKKCCTMCCAYERYKKCLQDFGEKPEGKKQRGDVGLDRRKMIKLIINKWYEGADWIHRVQNRVQWRC
jgi:hypothetical protein